MRLDVCPHCGKIGTLHRSRSRSFYERAVKFLLPYKIYRCSNCGWRGFRYTGWVDKLFGKSKRQKKIAKWKLYFLLFLIFALLILTRVYFEKIGTALAPIVKEILQK